jgi:hypothetical protein
MRRKVLPERGYEASQTITACSGIESRSRPAEIRGCLLTDPERLGKLQQVLSDRAEAGVGLGAHSIASIDPDRWSGH